MLFLVPDTKLLILKNRHAQKVTLNSLHFYLSLFLPYFFAFLAEFFFSFPGHLVGFISVGRVSLRSKDH